jgi:hypothetical protein
MQRDGRDTRTRFAVLAAVAALALAGGALVATHVPGRHAAAPDVDDRGYPHQYPPQAAVSVADLFPPAH